MARYFARMTRKPPLSSGGSLRANSFTMRTKFCNFVLSSAAFFSSFRASFRGRLQKVVVQQLFIFEWLLFFSMSASFDFGLLLLSVSLVMLVLIFTLSDYFLFLPIFAALAFVASLALLKAEEIAAKKEKGIILRGLEWAAAFYWGWFLAFFFLFAFSLFYGEELRFFFDNVLSIMVVSGLAGFAVTLKLQKLVDSVMSPRILLWSDVLPEDSFTLQFSHRLLALVFSFGAVFIPLGALLWLLSLLRVYMPLTLLLPLFSLAAAALTIYFFNKDKSEKLQVGMRKVYLYDLLHDTLSNEASIDFVKSVKLRQISESDEYFVEVAKSGGERFISKLKDVKGFLAACAENRLKII